MKHKFTVAVLGCGGRGYTYACLFNKRDEFEITYACDHNPLQLENMKKSFNISDDKLFLDEKELLTEKKSDILVISTPDRDHVRQCIMAMKLGYDVLLEKPISDSREEIEQLLKMQKETNRVVVVCHVLRYSVGIKKLDDLISQGVVGKILAIDHFERVAFWHQAQAYVRLQKHYRNETVATILAKCCHDLDLIQHFAGARCRSVSSIGDLAHFRKENTPDGATERCLDCPHVHTCKFSAKRIYIDFWKSSGCPKFIWPWNKVTLKNPTTEEDLYEGLKTTVFGECVYKCGTEVDPHVVDRQMVQMHFENNIIASLKMVFGSEPGRRIDIFGTEGQITLDAVLGTIEIKPYFGEKEVIQIKDLPDVGWGHGGGDIGLVNSMYDILTGKNTEFTSLEESVESHLIGIAAEESRLENGKLVLVH